MGSEELFKPSQQLLLQASKFCDSQSVCENWQHCLPLAAQRGLPWSAKTTRLEELPFNPSIFYPIAILLAPAAHSSTPLNLPPVPPGHPRSPHQPITTSVMCPLIAWTIKRQPVGTSFNPLKQWKVILLTAASLEQTGYREMVPILLAAAPLTVLGDGHFE